MADFYPAEWPGFILAGTAHKGRAVTLSLRDFMIPPDDVPADVQKAITHWSQWIDYWGATRSRIA